MKKFVIFIIPLILVITSCSKEEVLLSDHFFIENDGATMPVLVRGNLNSGVIVLFLHGGPGGNASQASFLPSFQDLEEDVAIAYWDQRASGLAQGNPNKSTFTVEQFVEDADYVIQALKLRYSRKSIFLLGHSWGGALGSAYLSTEGYQDKINGFICMNSGHNLLKGLPLSVDWVENYANEQIDDVQNVAYWTEVKQWCQKDPDMTDPENYFTYVEYLRETDAYIHENKAVDRGDVGFGDIFNSRMSLAAMVNGRYLGQNFNILELELSDDMNRINIPSRVIWGVHDGVNTLEMGYDAYNAIGTDPSHKSMVLLQNSAHEGYVEEPEKFTNAVKEFISEYK